MWEHSVLLPVSKTTKKFTCPGRQVHDQILLHQRHQSSKHQNVKENVSSKDVLTWGWGRGKILVPRIVSTTACGLQEWWGCSKYQGNALAILFGNTLFRISQDIGDVASYIKGHLMFWLDGKDKVRTMLVHVVLNLKWKGRIKDIFPLGQISRMFPTFGVAPANWLTTWKRKI